MAHLPQTLERFAQLGASIEFSENSNYLPQTVERIIQIVASKGGTIVINANTYLPQTIERFVMIGKGCVRLKV